MEFLWLTRMQKIEMHYETDEFSSAKEIAELFSFFF